MFARFLQTIGFAVVLTLATVFISGAVLSNNQAYATTVNSGACPGGGDDCKVNMPQAVISQGTFKSIMQIIFGVAGVLSVLFIAIGGFKYVFSAGDASGLSSAKNTILYAVVGLVISLSAFTIVQFALGAI